MHQRSHPANAPHRTIPRWRIMKPTFTCLLRLRGIKDLAHLGDALGGISLFCEDVRWVESAGRGQIADPAKAALRVAYLFV
jgi:hypothetical protein